MKILMTCDPELPVPPGQYGGVERLVDGLITEYSASGHQVYLLAHHASTATAALQIFAWPALSSRGYSNILRNTKKLYTTIRQLNPDVVHSFSRLLYTYPALLASSVPFLQTYGREISIRTTNTTSRIAGQKMHFTACGAHMLNHLPNTEHWTTVHNFTNTNYFRPCAAQRDHLMFLGRIEDIKGTREAIDVALATNNKLIIAGNIATEHQAYFDQYVQPHLQNPLIEYVGAVNDEQKRHYLQRAKALLFPIKWEEPFGIVMIESTACGAPVIAFSRGAAPEVIQEGINGHLTHNTRQMIQAVQQLEPFDENTLHKHTEQHFSTNHIAQQYLNLLTQLHTQNAKR